MFAGQFYKKGTVLISSFALALNHHEVEGYLLFDQIIWNFGVKKCSM